MAVAVVQRGTHRERAAANARVPGLALALALDGAQPARRADADVVGLHAPAGAVAHFAVHLLALQRRQRVAAIAGEAGAILGEALALACAAVAAALPAAFLAVHHGAGSLLLFARFASKHFAIGRGGAAAPLCALVALAAWVAAGLHFLLTLHRANGRLDKLHVSGQLLHLVVDLDDAADGLASLLVALLHLFRNRLDASDEQAHFLLCRWLQHGERRGSQLRHGEVDLVVLQRVNLLQAGHREDRIDLVAHALDGQILAGQNVRKRLLVDCLRCEFVIRHSETRMRHFGLRQRGVDELQQRLELSCDLLIEGTCAFEGKLLQRCRIHASDVVAGIEGRELHLCLRERSVDRV